MASFDDLFKPTNTAEQLSQKLTEMNKGGESYKDDRMFELQRGKDGTAYAMIRFLPPTAGDELPFVKYFSHGGQGPGGWYIENCPTTIGGKCPLCAANNVLWKEGGEKNQTIVRSRKRKLHYVSNILVLSNPSNKETEGKVYLFRYGQKIFNKIQECLQPPYPDVAPSDPFNVVTGRNFRLKICTVEGYANYDQSQFDQPSPLLNGDKDRIRTIWSSQHKLSEFVDPTRFKSFDELQKRYEEVFESTAPVRRTAEDKKPSAAPTAATKKVEVAPFTADATEQDALKYFEELSKED
jgi:hypothetical protein